MLFLIIITNNVYGLFTNSNLYVFLEFLINTFKLLPAKSTSPIHEQGYKIWADTS